MVRPVLAVKERRVGPGVVVLGAVSLLGCGPGAARGIQVSEVTATSGAGITLFADGRPTDRLEREGPIVRGRDTYFLVHVEVDPGWEARDIEAALTVTVGGQRYVDRQVRRIEMSTAAWAEDPTAGARFDLHATDFGGFVFGLDAAFVEPDLGWQVSLHEVRAGAGGSAAAARPVPDAESAVGVEPDAVRYQFEIAPFRYRYGSCNQRTNLDDDELQPFLDRLYAQFPVQDIDLSILDRPIRFEQPLVDRDAILATVASRLERGVGPDTYTVAMVQGCSPGDLRGLFGRAGSIPRSLPHAGMAPFLLSFMYRNDGTSDEPQDYEIETFVHEQAHVLGRTHVACGAPDGKDRGFPYPGGEIGTWGMNIVTGQLFHPRLAHDYMSYCESKHVSSYTWAGLFRRLADHTARSDHARMARGTSRTPWLLGVVTPGEEDRWLRVVGPDGAYDGEPLTLTVQHEAGPDTQLSGIAHAMPYSEDTIVLAPFPDGSATGAEVAVNGILYRVPIEELAP